MALIPGANHNPPRRPAAAPRFWDNVAANAPSATRANKAVSMTDFVFIDSPVEAESLARSLRDAPRLAIDTEFVREDTYSGKLCLLQVSDGEHIACVDVLALDGVGPFGALLTDPGITKVFHAARQDQEILYELLGTVPAPVWDTQIAAALVGHADQVGYAALVSAELGEPLAKDHARTDWSRRPLSPEQLEYAADDVRHLLPLADRLGERLEALGRTAWAEEESAALTDVRLYAFDAGAAWRRVKAAGQLEGEALARLVALARWREEEARRRNRPRRWILKDDALMDLARTGPDTAAGVATVPSVPPAVARRHGAVLAEVAARAAGDAPPERPAGGRMEPAQDRAARKIMGRLREIAEAQQVSAPLVATRRDVERLVLGDRDLPLLSGWRREIAGQALLEMLEAR